MRTVRAMMTLAAVAGVPLQARAQEHPLLVPPTAVTWSPPSPRGTSVAVLEGNPAVAGAMFTILFRMPDGAWLPPHVHPTDLRLVVLSGTLLFGTGERLVAGDAARLPAGSFGSVPANAPHYEGAEGEMIMLITGMGPLQTRFLAPPSDAADRP